MRLRNFFGYACLLASLVVASSSCEGPSSSNPDEHGLGVIRTGAPALDRLFALRSFKGCAYKPAPSNYNGDGSGIYYDSDFCNDDFKELRGPSGRNDIAKLRAAGAGIIHIYDWNQPGSGRNHRNFLSYCNSQKLCVVIPISKYYAMQVQANNLNVATWFKNFISEAYSNGKPTPSVVMWSLGNEFDNGSDQTAEGIAQTAQLLIAAEDAAGIPESQRIAITSPVTYGRRYGNNVEGAGAALKLKDAFTAAGLSTAWNTRFVAAVNSFNPGSDLGPWVATLFPQAVPNTPFMLFEMGKEIGMDVQNEEQQGACYAAQLAATVRQSSSENFLGPFVFSFVDEA